MWETFPRSAQFLSCELNIKVYLESNHSQMFDFIESKAKMIYTAQIEYRVENQEGKVLK